MKLTAWELVLLEELVRERLNGLTPGGNYYNSITTLLDKIVKTKPVTRKRTIDAKDPGVCGYARQPIEVTIPERDKPTVTYELVSYRGPWNAQGHSTECQCMRCKHGPFQGIAY